MLPAVSLSPPSSSVSTFHTAHLLCVTKPDSPGSHQLVAATSPLFEHKSNLLYSYFLAVSQFPAALLKFSSLSAQFKLFFFFVLFLNLNSQAVLLSALLKVNVATFLGSTAKLARFFFFKGPKYKI